MADGLDDYVQALVYTSVNDVIFHLRVDGERFRFLHINAAFTRATGLTPEMVVGKFVMDIIPEPSRSIAVANYHKAIAERRTVRWEEVTEYPTGTKIGEVSVTPVVEPDGRITQLVGTVRDVTETRAQAETIRRLGDLVQQVHIGLGVLQIGDPAEPRTYKIAALNPEIARIARLDLAGAVGKPLPEVLPPTRGGNVSTLIAAVARDRVAREMPAVRSVVDPAIVLAAKAFPLPGNSVGVALEDVSSTYRATHLQAGERRALEQLASGAPIAEILETLVDMIQGIEPAVAASILLVDDDGGKLRHGAAPRLPERYNRAIDGAPIGPKAGSCGTAAYRREPVYVSDILIDPLWEDYRDLARGLAMRACWSTPILDNRGRVLGTFAIYQPEAGQPDAPMLELIARATHVAAIVLERRRLDDELRELPARIEAVREDERTGIAREIHDELGQAMTALKLDLAWIARRTKDAPEVAAKLIEMTAMTDDIIHAVRRISAELRPGILDDLGLAAALEWQADEFTARTGVVAEVHCDIGELRVERNLSTAIFRIYQEALTNVARHAGATRVDITMRRDGDTLRVEIADDGIGLPETTRGGALGLVGMRERARRLGGDCVVSRREPRGTLVSLTVPLRQRS